MCDEEESVSIAVNGKPVRSSGHRGAVSGEMLVMRDVRALGKLGVCSKRASWDETSRGACEHVCRGDEARRCGLGSNGGSEERPEVGGKARGDWTGSTERVCDTAAPLGSRQTQEHAAASPWPSCGPLERLLAVAVQRPQRARQWPQCSAAEPPLGQSRASRRDP
jgi:hypothetical protein